LKGSAEAIPLESKSVDTVVTTWTLCTIPEVARALSEMRRVLKPGGRLLFVEHGRSPDPNVRCWQDRLTPLWKRIGGGCHLNRAIGQLIEESGFRIENINTGYMKGPKPMTFMYEGSARPK
jgi:ubiquinone/menaquinone biosynthesis C-methylase UbiE